MNTHQKLVDQKENEQLQVSNETTSSKAFQYSPDPALFCSHMFSLLDFFHSFNIRLDDSNLITFYKGFYPLFCDLDPVSTGLPNKVTLGSSLGYLFSQLVSLHPSLMSKYENSSPLDEEEEEYLTNLLEDYCRLFDEFTPPFWVRLGIPYMDEFENLD